MTKLNAYQISNSVSGAVLGIFIAENEDAALDALAVEAGYKSHADIPDAMRAADGELIVVDAYGTREDLIAQIKNAAAEYREDEEGEPGVLYVQLSRKHGWTAAFAEEENHHNMDMTRWDTGEDVVKLYADTQANAEDAVADYAGDIIGGWDSDWTDD